MLAVTVDVDWAPDPIMDAVVGIFDRHRIPITLFCTDPDTDQSGNSSCLAGRYRDHHELGLHPNFSTEKGDAAVFDGLRKHYPGAVGFRSHNGNSSWAISTYAAEREIRYQLECYVFPVDIPPFQSNPWTKTLHIFTTRFMDSWALPARNFGWTVADLGLTRAATDDDSIVILAFHPVILYYDTASVAEYQQRKPTYHEVDERASFLYKRPRGPLKLVTELLADIDRRHFTTIRGFAAAKRLW